MENHAAHPPSPPPSPPPPIRSRSVMDYDTDKSLRFALRKRKSEEPVSSVGGGADDAASWPSSRARTIANALCETCSEAPAPLRDWELANLDLETSHAQDLDTEMERLKTLRSYLILDANREDKFERITALASRIFDVPIALVSLVDLGRQWFMSNRGLDARETPRDVAFCAHAILSKQDIFIVPDAKADKRFSQNSLVTGPPNIRFYAGAPLICPEGYKLGTLCIIDTKTRPDGLSLDEKQNLRELADLVMDTLVHRKVNLENSAESTARTIACTAHDLLTPLTGLQLNLSLLMDDDNLRSKMNDHQRDLIKTGVNCSEMMGRICSQAIETFRGDVVQHQRHRRKQAMGQNRQSRDREMNAPCSGADDGDTDIHMSDPNEEEEEEGKVNLSHILENLGQVIEPYPKMVPLTMEIAENVPPVIISDDLKIFRSALNYLTNACKHTKSGSVSLRVYVEERRPHGSARKPERGEGGRTCNRIVFECEDTGPGIDVESYANLFVPFVESEGDKGTSPQDGADHSKMANSGLGLFSVASNIDSLGGEYGFRPRNIDSNPIAVPEQSKGLENPLGPSVISHASTLESSGSIFWFSIPLVLPASAPSERKDNTPTQTEAMASAGTSAENVGGRGGNFVIPPTISSRVVKPHEAKEHTANVPKVENGRKAVKKSLRYDAAFQDAPNNMLPPPSRSGLRGLLTREISARDLDDRPVRIVKKRALAKQESIEKDGTVFDTLGAREQRRGSDTKESDSKPSEQSDKQCATGEGVAGGKTSGGPSETKTRKRRALVIDDSLTIRKSISRALTKFGFEVAQAENGMVGLSKMKSIRFDLVLCDFLMPVMDGLDCVNQYRRWESGHRPGFQQYIVGISAHATSKDAERGIKSGMNSFYAKPIALKLLKGLTDSLEVIAVSKQLDEAYRREALRGKAGSMTSLASLSRISTRSARPVCLLAEESISVAASLRRCIEGHGWCVSVVSNGEDALRLLKMRNWEAVFIDDQIPRLTGTSCVIRFREWEAEHRVARQRNVHLISGNYKLGVRNIFPQGFDGAMGKPVDMNEFSQLLGSIAEEVVPGEILLRS